MNSIFSRIFIFLTISACLVACENGLWDNGDNWIVSSLKASQFYQQLSSTQRQQLENIADNDQFTENQILQQLSQYGRLQLQGNQRIMFNQWLQQLTQQNQQYLRQAQILLGQVSSQAQPYGQQILQVLQNTNINPNQEDDQVNNIIRSTPTSVRTELLNVWNQLQQYQLQQRQQLGNGLAYSSDNNVISISSGYNNGGNYGYNQVPRYSYNRDQSYGQGGYGYSSDNNVLTLGSGYSSGGNYAYNQAPRYGYNRDQSYGQSGYGYVQKGSRYNNDNAFPTPGSRYNNQYNQGYSLSSSGYGYNNNRPYSNSYNLDDNAFPTPSTPGQFAASNDLNIPYSTPSYVQSSYGQTYTNNGYGAQQSQLSYGQSYGSVSGQSNQNYANTGYGKRKRTFTK
uniref:Uncharacterized protein n=1 Tax=Acrobeloides nanus TaxID=290746 RepID=A0A914E4G5_9BILA